VHGVITTSPAKANPFAKAPWRDVVGASYRLHLSSLQHHYTQLFSGSGPVDYAPLGQCLSCDCVGLTPEAP
jgi:hypothetical protein